MCADSQLLSVMSLRTCCLFVLCFQRSKKRFKINSKHADTVWLTAFPFHEPSSTLQASVELICHIHGLHALSCKLINAHTVVCQPSDQLRRQSNHPWIFFVASCYKWVDDSFVPLKKGIFVKKLRWNSTSFYHRLDSVYLKIGASFQLLPSEIAK